MDAYHFQAYEGLQTAKRLREQYLFLPAKVSCPRCGRCARRACCLTCSSSNSSSRPPCLANALPGQLASVGMCFCFWWGSSKGLCQPAAGCCRGSQGVCCAWPATCVTNSD